MPFGDTLLKTLDEQTQEPTGQRINLPGEEDLLSQSASFADSLLKQLDPMIEQLAPSRPAVVSTPLPPPEPEQIREQRAAGFDMAQGGAFTDIKQRFLASGRMSDIERGISRAMMFGDDEKAKELVRIRKEVLKMQEESAKEDTSGFFGSISDVVGYMYDNLKQSLAEAGIGAAAGTVIPGVGTLAGAGTGLFVGQIRAAAEQGAGMMYADLLDKGIKPDLARKVALPSGVLYGLIENVFSPAALIQKPLFKPMQRYMARTLGEAALRVAGKYVSNVVGEVSEEAAQQAVGDLTYAIAREFQDKIAEDGSPLAEITGSDIWANAVEAAKQSVGPMAVLGGLGSVASVKSEPNLRSAAKGVREAAAAEKQLGLTPEQGSARFEAEVGGKTATPGAFSKYLQGLAAEFGQREQAKADAATLAAEQEQAKQAELETATQTEKQTKLDAAVEELKTTMREGGSVNDWAIKNAELLGVEEEWAKKSKRSKILAFIGVPASEREELYAANNAAIKARKKAEKEAKKAEAEPTPIETESTGAFGNLITRLDAQETTPATSPVLAPEGEAKAGVQPPTAPATAPATTQEKVEPVTPALGAASVTAREDVAPVAPVEPESARAGTSEFDTIIEKAKTKKATEAAKREAKLTQGDKAMDWAMKGDFKEGMTFNEALATLPEGVTKAAATKALQQAGWSKGRRSAGMKRGDEPLVRVTVSVPRAGVETGKIEAKGGTVGVTEETPQVLAEKKDAIELAAKLIINPRMVGADAARAELKDVKLYGKPILEASKEDLVQAQLEAIEKAGVEVTVTPSVKKLQETLAPLAPLTERLNTEAKPDLGTIPEGATFVRVTNAKGQTAEASIADLKAGKGGLTNAGPYSKVEFGNRDMKGTFKPIEGMTTKEAVKEGAVMGFLTLKSSARVPKASGGTAYLKAGEKFTAYDLGDGRILLKDGKQVTVMEGDLPESVKAQITKTPNITAGGLTPQQIAAREAKSEELPAKWNQATRQVQGKFMAWKNNEANQKQYGFKANNVQAAWEAYRGLTIEGKVQGKKFIRDKEAKDAIIGITNEAKNLAQKNRQSGKLPRPTPLMGFLRKAGRAVFNMSTILQRGLGENAHKLWLNHRTRVGRIFAELRNEHRQTMTSPEAQALYRNADLFQKGKYGALGEVTRQEALEFRNIGLHMAIQEAVRAYDSGGAEGLRAWYEKKVQEPGWEHLKNDLRPLLRTDSKDGMSVDEKQVYILGNDMRELNLSIRDIANIPLNKDEIKLADFLLSRLQKNSEKYGSTRKALSGDDIPLHAIYHPIVRDYKRVGGDLADMVEENNKKAQLYGPTLMTDYDMDKMGIAQTRKSNRIPFIIRGEMDTVNQNAMDTARYIAFTEFFNTWKGIFRSREAVNELRDSIGQDAIDTINRKLDTMEGVIYSDTASEWQRLGSFVLGKTTAAALSGIPIVLYQPSSALQYGLKFGWKNLAKAVAQILTPEGRSLAKKILQSAPMIINRADDVRIETGLTDTRARAQSLYFTRAWKRTQDKGLRIKGTLEEAQRTALTGLQKADEFAQLLGLLTVYNNYKSTGKALDFNKIAADTESTMVDTQSSADPLDMTGLRLSKSGTVRLLSILSGEASAVFNVVTRAIDNASKIAKAVREGAATVAQRDQAFKTVAETLFTVAAMSAWVATIKAGRDKLLKKEDDEEDFYEKMGWRFLENMTGYLPFPSIFGPTVNELVARTLRDTQRTGKYNIQTQNWYGFGQRLPESILRITKAADQYWKYSSGMSGDRKLTPREAARYAEWAGNNAGKALLGILETTTGVGVEQNARIIDAIMRKTGILTE